MEERVLTPQRPPRRFNSTSPMLTSSDSSPLSQVSTPNSYYNISNNPGDIV